MIAKAETGHAAILMKFEASTILTSPLKSWVFDSSSISSKNKTEMIITTMAIDLTIGMNEE